MYNKAKNHIDQSKIVISCYRRTTNKRSILYQGCKLWNSEISKNLQKQPRRGVPRKRCSKNKQKIYRRTLMPKCDFNHVALQLYWNHTSAWAFSCKSAAYFKNTFSYEHLLVSASELKKVWQYIVASKIYKVFKILNVKKKQQQIFNLFFDLQVTDSTAPNLCSNSKWIKGFNVLLHLQAKDQIMQEVSGLSHLPGSCLYSEYATLLLLSYFAYQSIFLSA